MVILAQIASFLLAGGLISSVVTTTFGLPSFVSSHIQKNLIAPLVKEQFQELDTTESVESSPTIIERETQTVVIQPTPPSSLPGLTVTDTGGTETVTIKEITTIISSSSALPTGDTGSTLYLTSSGWKAGTELYNDGTEIGMGSKNPDGRLHIVTGDKERKGLVIQGAEQQTALLFDLKNHDGTTLATFNKEGKLTINNASNDHALEINQTGDAGYLSSSGGAIFINNTSNIGTGLGIFSNAGSDALGNMINVKVDNPLYNQAAFYMNYDGISNAVEIVANTNDSSSNALSVTNFNTQDSALGIIGYETGKGTVKISHNGTGTDANASGLSIDLKGTGTRAQGLYVDSTASSGTLGDLLRLRNQSIDRFVVDYLGSVSMGGNGTNTSFTKYGNTAGDEFFVGTNGAFRVQRSASDSEAFRVQINGDSQGRWLGTSDGKLKWGDGSSAQDVVLRRSAANTLLLDDATFTISSRATNTDLSIWTATDNSRLGRFVETSGGAGWFEVDDSSGTAQIVFRGDGGSSYILSGNFGIGTSSFGTSASKVLALGNGTAPSTSITDGVQLYAIDYDDSDGGATSELFVRDEDGNATNLSPHNFTLIPEGPSEKLAWSYYSERDGEAINVDMAKTVRLVEQLTGTQLIYMKNLSTGENLSLSSPALSFSPVTLAPSDELVETVEKKIAEKETEYLKKSEIETHIRFSSVLEILSSFVVKAKTTFEQSVEFLAGVVFKGKVQFEGDVVAKGKLHLNSDQLGKVVIKAGQKEVTVTFSSSFAQEPIITVTPTEYLKGTYWIKKNTSTFTLYLSDIQEKDVSFDWHALGSENGISTTESATQLQVTPIITPSISEENVSSVAAVASESAR